MVELVWGLIRGKSRVSRLFILSAVVGLSIPSTIQHLAKQMSDRPTTVSRNTVALVGFLERLCSHGEVVFSREQLAPVLMAMTKCRVPLCCEVSAPLSAPTGRRNLDLRDFWDATASDELRGEILQRYDASYLVIDRRTDNRPPPPIVVTRPLFENQDFAVYLVPKPR